MTSNDFKIRLMQARRAYALALRDLSQAMVKLCYLRAEASSEEWESLVQAADAAVVQGCPSLRDYLPPVKPSP